MQTRLFIDEVDIPLHSAMPLLIIDPLWVLSSRLSCRRNDRCFDGKLPVDVGATLRRMVREVAPADSARYASVTSQLFDMTRGNALREGRSAATQRYPNRPVLSTEQPNWSFGQ